MVPGRTIHVAGLTLSPDLRRLSRGDEPVPVEPLVLDLIIVLVRERHRIVSKQELFDEVWAGVVVATGALDRALHEARRVLGDRGDRQTAIRTIRGKGYQFVAPVKEALVRNEVRADPLFGRDAVLAELSSVLAAHRRALRIVAIEGEAGIGKTSLAERMAALAEERGYATRVGRCTPTQGSPPFWPWIQVIAADGDRLQGPLGLGAPSPTEIAALVGAPELGHLDGRVEQARFWLFDAVERHFQQSVDRPQLWILDDLQWADEASLHLLAHLAGASLDHPIVVVATFRDEGIDRDHAIRHTLESCRTRAPVDLVRLRGLDAAALRLLSVHLTGDAASSEVIDALRERTGGNPFLATEILLRNHRSAPTSATSSPSSPVDSAQTALASLVRSRLELLDDDAQELLAVASVIGRRFDADRVAQVAGRSVEQVGNRLDEAVRAGIVVGDRVEPGRYEFRHDLLRESLYSSLSPSERLALHRRVGEAIESLYGPHAGRKVEELAHHFHAASDPAVGDKAIEYSVKAGEAALAQFGFEQASRHFENALSGLEREQSRSLRRQARILLALADSAKRGGDKSRAQEALHRAADLGRRLDDPGILIQAAFVLQLALSPIEVSTSEVRDVELLREALEHVPAENHGVRARLLARLATAFYWRPIHARPRRRGVSQPTLDAEELEAFGWSPSLGVELADRAIATAWEADDPATLACALSARYIALSRTQRTDERRTIAQEVVRLAETSEDWELRLVGQGLLLTELVQWGEAEAAFDVVESIRAIAERLRHPLSRWHASLGQVLALMIRGRFAEAEDVATQAYQRTRGDVNLAVEDCFIQQRFSMYRLTGRAPQLEQTIREAAHRYGRMSNFVLMLAHVALDRGRQDEARLHLDWACANDFEEIGENMLSLFTTVLAAELCAAVGSGEQARSLYDRLLPHSGRCVTINFVCFEGPVDRVLGLLADRLGDPVNALRHLECAIERMRSMGSVAWLAQCLMDAASIGRRGVSESTAARWKEYARESEDLAKRHGLVLS